MASGRLLIVAKRRLASGADIVVRAKAMCGVEVDGLPWSILRKHRRAIAIVVSIGLHILFALCLLSNAEPGLASGGRGGVYQGDGDGIGVEVFTASFTDTRLSKVPDIAEDEIQVLDGAEKLDKAISETNLSDFSTVDLPALVVTAYDVSESSETATLATMHRGEGEAATPFGVADALWQAIAPCWHRLAEAETQPVSLLVTFGSGGGLASAPTIERDPNDAADPRVLRSELLALRALSQCGTYEMAAGLENVRIEFPKP